MLKAGLLACALAAPPSHAGFIRHSGRVWRQVFRVYSCGDSSCFSQDSLLIRATAGRLRNLSAAKVVKFTEINTGSYDRNFIICCLILLFLYY